MSNKYILGMAAGALISLGGLLYMSGNAPEYNNFKRPSKPMEIQEMESLNTTISGRDAARDTVSLETLARFDSTTSNLRDDRQELRDSKDYIEQSQKYRHEMQNFEEGGNVLYGGAIAMALGTLLGFGLGIASYFKND